CSVLCQYWHAKTAEQHQLLVGNRLLLTRRPLFLMGVLSRSMILSFSMERWQRPIRLQLMLVLKGIIQTATTFHFIHQLAQPSLIAPMSVMIRRRVEYNPWSGIPACSIRPGAQQKSMRLVCTTEP